MSAYFRRDFQLKTQESLESLFKKRREYIYMYIYIYILYNVLILNPTSDTKCTMFGYLIPSDHQLYNVTPLKTSFGLLIPLLQSYTRNYIHSQLFFTLCHICTACNHICSWLQSLTTLLHWLTSQLSITVSNYRTLYIFTLWNSSRDLTPRINFLRLLLNNWRVGLLLTNWTKTANRFAYITRTSGTKSGASQVCCVTRGNAKVTRYSPTPVAGWRHRGMLRRNRIPILLHDVIASARKILFTGRLPSNALLRNPCCATHQWVDMSLYMYTYISHIASPTDHMRSRKLLNLSTKARRE
jgi:hypothetical protein